MKDEKNAAVADDSFAGRWLEDVDAELPEDILKGKEHGKLPPNADRVKLQLSIRRLPDGKQENFKAGLTETLLEVFERGARELGELLLPPGSATPLDRLHCREQKGGGWGEPLKDLERPLWLALAQGCTRWLGIEYVLAVKINTKWGVAPAADTTPRALLTSFVFDPAQFSLYRTDGAEPLPADAPLSLRRGDSFEAQKDGRYGASHTSKMRPPRGSQTIEDDVEAVQEAGVDARLLNVVGQKYVEVRGVRAPSPPWSSEQAAILIAIPATYPTSGLDALYIELPFKHSSGTIPYQSGTAQIDGRNWALISWHYATSRPWNSLHDDLASHIAHCRGFFLRRGVSQ